MRLQRALRSFIVCAAATVVGAPGTARAQHHDAIGPASGVPQGIPRFCASASVISVGSGAWSSSATWSSAKVPAVGDSVLIEAGTTVTYDVASDAALRCVDIEGTLAFRTDRNTRMKVGTLTVLENAALEIGTEASPIAAGVTAELIIAGQGLDTTLDPNQFGVGLIGLGRIRMHGAVRSPTFMRLAREPVAGDATLEFEQVTPDWRAGDKLVLPDTRQLKESERGTSYRPRWEELTIGSVSARAVTLTSPLAYDHPGARNADGMLEFLPHVGHLSRNVIVRSENPNGTRGHTIFVARADVDIRYVLFKDLGRTRIGVLNSTEFDAAGKLLRVGTNQIGRYSIHFHHAFGRKATPVNGYQFTLIGNAVDDASKWGITIHNSHYGLIQDNVVYNSRGAAIVTEDGTESFNVFAHNFALRSEGSGEFAPRSGYGGATADPGGEGAGFWFRGANNYIRDNVAANVDVSGYGLAAGALGTIRIPRFKGADSSTEGEYTLIDTVDGEVLEFTGNEAYGATQTGVAIGWNGTLSSSRIWHTHGHGLTAFPTDRLTIDGFKIRGDSSVLAGRFENATGIWFGNYVSKSLLVKNADIQGLRVGAASPFFANTISEPGRGDGVAIVENSYFRNYVGLAIATAYSTSSSTGSLKKAIVRNTQFRALDVAGSGMYPPAAISMNYGTSAGDLVQRDPVVVYDFNQVPGDNFRVFYSNEIPAPVASCGETRPDIGGFVCPGDGALSRSETRR